MKLVYLANSDIPSRSANSLHIMKMCYEFAKLGNKVVLITLYDKKGLEKGVQDIHAFYGVENNFKIIRIPFLISKGRSYFSLFSAFLAKLQKPDIVYGRNFEAIYRCMRMGLTVAFEAHDYFPKSCSQQTVTKFKSFLTYEKAVLFTVTSNSLLNSFESQFEIRVPTFVAHNGANELKNVVTPKAIAKNDMLNAGYIGQLYGGKGMEIISALIKRCPDVFFHIIGGFEKDIEEWKQELKEHSNVCFYGFVPHAETEAYRQAMDVLLAPYLSKVKVVGGSTLDATWMTPIKLFEYMASKKAIISSSLPVAKEIVENKVNGVLCDPDNIEEWVAALEELKNQSFRDSLAEKALETFLKNLSWEARAKKISESLKKGCL